MLKSFLIGVLLPLSLILYLSPEINGCGMPTGPTITYSTNTTISSPTAVPSSIIVNSGVTLTITTTLEFREWGKLTIKPGGKVILDGGILTREPCFLDFMWEGVIIEGTSTSGQIASGSYHPDQGVLIMKNGAGIEWANLGVISTEGGVIAAEDSYFENCRVSVEIKDYTNPDDAAKNYCKFTDCDFICNDELTVYVTGQTNTVEEFVKLTEVRGIKFSGNHFTNSVSHSLIYNSPNLGKSRGIGVKMFNASASFFRTADPFELCPNASGRKNEFHDLYVGIDYHTYKGYGLHVVEAVFDNIQRKPLSVIGGNAFIGKCQFIIDNDCELLPWSVTGSVVYPYSTFSSSASVYLIQNFFSLQRTESDQQIFAKDIQAFVIYNSGTSDVNAYQNTFERINSNADNDFKAFVFIGHNALADLQCNVLNSTHTFLNIKKGVTQNQGLYEPYIFPDQGSVSADAGNILNPCTSPYADGDRITVPGNFQSFEYYVNQSDPNKYPSSCLPTTNPTFIQAPDNPCAPFDFCNVTVSQ